MHSTLLSRTAIRSCCVHRWRCTPPTTRLVTDGESPEQGEHYQRPICSRIGTSTGTGRTRPTGRDAAECAGP
jgi:hypothetical protein